MQIHGVFLLSFCVQVVIITEEFIQKIVYRKVMHGEEICRKEMYGQCVESM